MRRAAVTTPLILWVCAAVVAHFGVVQGGWAVAKIHDDRSSLWSLAVSARERVWQESQTIEVSLLEPATEAPPTLQAPDEQKPDEKLVDPQKPPPPETKVVAPPPKNEEPKPPPPKPELKPKLVIVPQPPEVKPPPPPPIDPLKDKRIAVRQHVEKEVDNPNAHLLAEKGNKVEHETQATQTSHDRDDKNPTPAGNHAGPDKRAGDSNETKVRESEERRGDKDRAPGEKGRDGDLPKTPAAPVPTVPATAERSQPPPPAPPGPTAKPAAPADGRPPGAQAAPKPAAPADPGGAKPQSPAVVDAQGGAWDIITRKPADAAQPGKAATRPGQPLPAPGPSAPQGFNKGPVAPGRLNTNIGQRELVAAVGLDNLRRMREADGERRKSEHRGSWQASTLQQWRSAIENYVASVRPGNQTQLNTAASPFATYLNSMHNRIHPIFADSFLGSLDNLPREHPLSDMKRFTRLEIILTKEGRVQKMGVVRGSGLTAFDLAALDSVNRAQPFGPAPSAIVSPDGNVYLQWEFHRDEVYACSTMNARPYLLNVQPKGPDPEPQPPPAAPPAKERGLPPANPHDAREGALPPLLRGLPPG